MNVNPVAFIRRVVAWRARRRKMHDLWFMMMVVTDSDDVRRLHDEYRVLKDTPF